MLLSGKRVWVTGKGMVGKSLIKILEKKGIEVFSEAKKNLDLRDQIGVRNFLKNYRPDFIFQTAAKVGGIYANSKSPANFIYDNLAIQSNIIHQAHLFDINHLVSLGSSCVYPKESPQPIKEEYLLSGPLEETNQWYAVAKIAGAKMTEAYKLQYERDYYTVFPTNLYGPEDNFNLETSHVVPALIKKIHIAKIKKQNYFEVWGDGTALREFLHVDDLAEGLIFIANNNVKKESLNIGSKEEISIKSLCKIIKKIIDYDGEIKFDHSKPNGTMRKKTALSKITKLGWAPKIDLESGIKLTYEWFKENEV